MCEIIPLFVMESRICPIVHIIATLVAVMFIIGAEDTTNV